MSTPLVYLLGVRLKNQLKDLVRKPAKLIYLLILAALLCFVIFTGQTAGAVSGGFRDRRELQAIVTAFFLLMFFIVANNGFGQGASLFKMPDVNLLFAGPFRPGTVLFYGLFQQLGTSLLMGFFILFQYAWMHDAYGAEIIDLVWMLLGYGLTVFTAQLTAMLIYVFISGKPRRRKLLRTVFIGLPAVYALWIFAMVMGDRANALSVLVDAAVSLPVRLFPVAGWLGGAVGGLLTGSVSMSLLGLGLWAAACAAVILWACLSEPDYYEDVLQTTESAFNTQTAAKEGRVTETAPQKLRKGKTGLGKGFGADAFYYKHRLENRRSRKFVLSTMELVFAICCIAFSLFVREMGLLPVFVFAVYMLFFTAALGRLIKELTKPYVYLVPEPPFKKLLWCLRESLSGFVTQAMVIFVPAGLILGLDVPEILAAIAAHISFSYLFTAGNLLSERLFGRVTVKMLMMLFYFLMILLLAAPGLVFCIILTAKAVMLISPEVTMCLALTICNVPMAVLGIFLCRNVLSYAELNQ